MSPLVVHRLVSRFEESLTGDERTEAIRKFLHHFIVVEVEAWTQPCLNVDGLIIRRGPFVPCRVLRRIARQVRKGLLVDETEVFARLLSALDLNFWIGTLEYDLIYRPSSNDVRGLELILRARPNIDLKGIDYLSTLLAPGILCRPDRHLRIRDSWILALKIHAAALRAGKLQTLSSHAAVGTLEVPLVKLYLAILVHWGGYCPKPGINGVKCITE